MERDSAPAGLAPVDDAKRPRLHAGTQAIPRLNLPDSGVVERSFRLRRVAGTVPGVVWLPSSPDSNVPRPPLILLGHGAAGTSETTGTSAWPGGSLPVPASRRRRSTGRTTATGPPPRWPPRSTNPSIVAEEAEVVLDGMAADWRAAVDALGALGIVDTGY